MDELRDYRQYISWQLVHLLRALKVVESLTPAQQKMIEAKSDLIAATMRGDVQDEILKAQKEGERDAFHKNVYMKHIPDSEVEAFQSKSMDWIKIDMPGYYEIGLQTTKQKEEE